MGHGQHSGHSVLSSIFFFDLGLRMLTRAEYSSPIGACWSIHERKATPGRTKTTERESLSPALILSRSPFSYLANCAHTLPSEELSRTRPRVSELLLLVFFSESSERKTMFGRESIRARDRHDSTRVGSTSCCPGWPRLDE